MITLHKAFSIYFFIQPFLPEDSSLDILEYVYNVVRNIRERGNDGDLVKLVKMFDPKANTDSSQVIISVLVKGLLEIQIEHLRAFVEGIRDGRQ